MTQILRRFAAYAEQLADERKLGRILIETGATPPQRTSSTPAGDERKLRGIPAVGRGVGGAINGTAPHRWPSQAQQARALRERIRR